jgi:hypothetical protein
MVDAEISIKDYVEASSEAATRTRRVTVVLMIASVLMFSGLLNSTYSSWKRQRMEALESVDSDYVKRRLGPPPSSAEDYSMYVARYNQLYSAALKDYVENAYTIRIPFFGIAIDTNDLGPLGGLALSVILVLYRTSITREIDNLRISFEGAEAQNRLHTFYYLLAMRQVLTFPNIHGKERSRFMLIAPKILIFTPLTIYSMIVLYDYYSFALYGFTYKVIVTMIQDAFFFAAVIVITFMIFIRLREIDKIWDHYWSILNEQKASRNNEAYSPIPDA